MNKKISYRWGIPWLKGGHTTIMNAMLRNYIKLGITRREMLFIIHLSSYAHESPNGECRPALTSRIREEMGYKTDDSVCEILKSLEGKGMVAVIRRRAKTSIYDFSPFGRAIQKLTGEEQEVVQLDCYAGVTVQPRLHPDGSPEKTGGDPREKPGDSDKVGRGPEATILKENEREDTSWTALASSSFLNLIRGRKPMPHERKLVREFMKSIPEDRIVEVTAWARTRKKPFGAAIHALRKGYPVGPPDFPLRGKKRARWSFGSWEPPSKKDDAEAPLFCSKCANLEHVCFCPDPVPERVLLSGLTPFLQRRWEGVSLP